MKKTFRKLIVTLLALAIAAAAPISAFAQPESSDNSMQTALQSVKNLLNLDDDQFTDFNYSSSYSNYEKREGLVWQFSWSDSGTGYVYAIVREDGTLIQFSKYNYQENSFGFAAISKDDAIAIAGEFVKKAKPDTYTYYKAPADISVNIQNGAYSFVYYAEVNGFPFRAAYVTVNVNKFTGEITGYGASGIDPRNFKYEEAAGIIGENEAVAAYAEKIGLSLEYRSYYNYEDNTVRIFPVYILNSGSDRYIGAVTGDIAEYIFDLGTDGNDEEGALYDRAGAASADSQASLSGGGSNAALSPAEIAAIEKVSSYITSDQALKTLLEAMELTDLDVNSFDEKYINLNRDYINRDRYCYDIGFYKYYGAVETRDDDIMTVSGRVDAESGRVINFYINYYGIQASGEEALTEEQAAAGIDTFLAKIAPDEYAKSEKVEAQNGDVVPYYYRSEYPANYIRYENGIPFRNNGLSASLNMNTGKVTRYNLNWYDNVSFPDISDILTEADALSEYVGINGSSIQYITTGDGNTTLVYDFTGGMYIDPFNGNALDYRGERPEDSMIVPDYSDIAGHWSEAVVKRLVDNGVYMWSGKFEPDKVMTELEFLQYLLLIEPYYYAQPIDDFFMERGVDIAADPDKELTRQEAVRIIVEYLGYKKLAQQSEWFIYPFSDSVDDDYKGYITICYMLGIIGGENGRFNAANNITRAQAAVILQNLIIAKS